MIPVEKYDEFCALMPIVCVNAIIFDGDKVLLVRRATPPIQGEFWLPGGRILKGEHVEEALMRKVREETGLDCEVIGLVSVSSTVFSSGHHTIDLNFVLHRTGGQVVLDSTSSDYSWADMGMGIGDLRPGLQRLLLQAKNSPETMPYLRFNIRDTPPRDNQENDAVTSKRYAHG
jgi:ADP-ribose pyrophosphatase YjhB (NUDIX family)